MPVVCGICGFLAPSGQGDRAIVERMNAALVHRGPDEGSVDAFGRCVLGNRRLQIIDLVTGSQPVENEAGDVVAVFNGEIYNFLELREELGKRGHEIRGTGDTPVIPHLYEEHGTRFAERLSGMFTVALWDRTRERLVLARDRVGKKPLLWTQLSDGSLAFASELKALLRLPRVSREVDPSAIDAYLALQYVPGGTGLQSVEKLPPGHVLVAESGSVRVERYAQLDQLGPESEGDWLALVRERVEEAVRRRLIADVPLGALLSGGIDSSIVVALMAQASTQPVRTFTVGFGDERYDERRYARVVAERYATEHEEIVLEEDVAGHAAAARGVFRRAARRRRRAPALSRLRGGAAARHGRAHGRRRRRVVRRLRALRRARARGPVARARRRCRAPARCGPWAASAGRPPFARPACSKPPPRSRASATGG